MPIFVEGLGGLAIMTAGIFALLFPRVVQRFTVGITRPEKSRMDAFYEWWFASDWFFWGLIGFGLVSSVFGFAIVFEVVTRALRHAV
ncbi:MAG TPA: hypothetical protein VN934_10475 [Candidatus Tumulicola sp.]|nr:hypothetical protein [Candidatus Tumulicola sp.]